MVDFTSIDSTDLSNETITQRAMVQYELKLHPHGRVFGRSLIFRIFVLLIACFYLILTTGCGTSVKVSETNPACVSGYLWGCSEHRLTTCVSASNLGSPGHFEVKVYLYINNRLEDTAVYTIHLGPYDVDHHYIFFEDLNYCPKEYEVNVRASITRRSK